MSTYKDEEEFVEINGVKIKRGKPGSVTERFLSNRNAYDGIKNEWRYDAESNINQDAWNKKYARAAQARKDALQRLQNEAASAKRVRNIGIPGNIADTSRAVRDAININTEPIKTKLSDRNPSDFYNIDGESLKKLSNNYIPPVNSGNIADATRKAVQAEAGNINRYKYLTDQNDFSQMADKGSGLSYGLRDNVSYGESRPGYSLDYITDKERDLYNYLLVKNGRESAENYLNAVAPILNERSMDEKIKKAENISNNPLFGIALNLVSSMASSSGYLAAISDGLTGKNVDVNNPSFLGSRIESVTREKLKNNKLPMVNKSTSNFLIDTGLSIGQSAMRLPFGQAGLALAGGSAATGSYLDAKERNATENQAILLGAAQGGAEMFFEKFSLEGLSKLKASPVTSFKTFIKNIAKQSFTEGSEEVATEFSNTLSDAAIMRELSNINTTYEEFMNQGYTDKEAKEKTFLNVLQNLGMAGLGGALSGGIMGSGAMALGTYNQGRNSNITNYQDIVDSVETDPDAYQSSEGYQAADQLRQIAEELAEKQKKGQRISTFEKGILENAVDHTLEVADNVSEQKSANTTKDITGTQNYTMPDNSGRLEEYSKQFSEYGQKAYTVNFDPSVPLDIYDKGFKDAYTAGRYGIEFEHNQSAAEALLNDDVRLNAYKAGMADRNQAENIDLRTGKPMEGGLQQTTENAPESLKKFAAVVGKKTGLQFIITDQLPNDANGAYSGKNRAVYISANSENTLATASHELTHFIKDQAPKQYQTYQDIAVQAIMESQDVDFERLVSDYMDRYSQAGQDLTREEAIDEIVADATERFFNDEEYITRVARQDRTITQKIVDFFSDIVESIKTLINKNTDSKAAKALNENLKIYEKARDIWFKALADASNVSDNKSLPTATNALGTLKTSETLSGMAPITIDLSQNTSVLNNKDVKFQLNQFGFEEYTDREKNWWKDSNIILCNSKQDIINFCNNNLHKKPYSRLYIGKVGSLLAEKIFNDTGIDLEGYNVTLTSEFENSHSDISKEKTRGQIPVTPEIIAELPEIISAYDEIETAGKTEGGKPALKFVKDINGKRVAVEYVRTKRKQLELQTMYAWGSKDNRSVPTTITMPEDLTRTATPEAYSGITPINETVSQKEDNFNDKNTKFSLKSTVEENKNLIVVHNLNEDKLLKAFQYDGIPMPSLAVTKAELGHENFGDISLVFEKATIDPKNRKNKVYGADAWTPTFPRIEYDINPEIRNNLYEIARSIQANIPESFNTEAMRAIGSIEENLQNYGNTNEVKEKMRNNYGMKAIYLASQGETLSPIYKEIREEMSASDIAFSKRAIGEFGDQIEQFSKMPLNEFFEDYAPRMQELAEESGFKHIDVSKWRESRLVSNVLLKRLNIIKDYIKTGGITVNSVEDTDAEHAWIDERIDESKYDAWIDENLDGAILDSGIGNGKELFTASGQRRSFQQTHYPINAENIVKSMLSQSDDARNVAGFNGIKSIRAVVAPEFKNINQIKEASGRIQTIETESYNKKVENLDDRLYSLLADIVAGKSGSSSRNSFIDMDRVGNVLLEAAGNKPTPGNIKKIFNQYSWKITDAQATEAYNIIRDVVDMPVNMFEAKPQRVVGYDEIAYAVVPDNVSRKVVDSLSEKGIKILEYDSEKEGSRIALINSLDDVKFQLKNTDNVNINRLQNENQKLKLANDELKRQFTLTKEYLPRQQDVSKIAKEILSEYNSNYEKQTLESNLTKLFKYIQNARNVDGAEVSEITSSIAKAVLKESKTLDTSMDSMYPGLRKTIKDYRIRLSDADKADLEVYGGYNQFRKNNFGRITLSKEGTPVDSVYQELSSQYPELFDEAITHPVDQLITIADTVEMLMPSLTNEYGANMDEMSYLVSQEIFDKYFDIRAKAPTFADKKAKELLETKVEYQRKIAAVKDDMKSKYEDRLRLAKEENNQKLYQMKLEYKTASAEQKSYYEQRIKFLEKQNKKLMASKQKTKEKVKRASEVRNIPTYTDPELKRLVEQYGAIPKGEKPMRNVEMPSQTSDNKKLSRFARTVMESGAIDDNMADDLKEAVLKEAMSYVPKTDKAAEKYAKWVLETNGIEEAEARWSAIANGKKIADKNDIALGEYLLKHYAETGNAKGVIKMTAELSTEATRAGQSVQAFRLLKKLTGYGEDGAAATLYYVKRTVSRMNKDLEKRFKNSKEKPQLHIDPSLEEKFVSAKTELEREAALGEIYKNLGEQLPSTLADKLTNWRYMSMLGNPRTHIRNFFGNVVFMPAVKLKNSIATGMEHAAIKNGEKTKSILVDKNYKEFALRDFENVKDVITGDSKGDITNEIQKYKRIYKTNLMEKMRKFNFKALELEDVVALKRHYISALSQYLNANKVDLNMINTNQTILEKARNYAIDEAQKATYRDASKLASAINNASNTSTAAHMFFEGILPFKKTPINILKRGVEYSPAGLVHALSVGTMKLNRGDITVNQYIDGISSGLSGTVIAAIGAFLAYSGILSGGFDDEDKELRKLRGEQEYAVKIGNKTYTIDWAAPTTIPLFIGAEFVSSLQENKEWGFADICNALTNLSEPMFNLSMLSGLNDTLEAVSFADNKLTALGTESLSSYLGQFVPTVLGQMTRTIDTTQRRTYVDKNKQIPKEVQYFIQRLMNKTPGLSYLNQPRLNQWGEEHVEKNIVEAAFENFISPGYSNELVDDPVNSELFEIYSEIGDKSVIPKYASNELTINKEKIYLTAEEYTTYQRTVGTTAYNLLDNLIENKTYGELEPESQALVISDVYYYAKEVGRISVIADYELNEWPAKAYKAFTESGLPIEEYIIFRNLTKDIKSDKDKDGEPINGSKKEKILDVIDSMNISKEQKDSLYLNGRNDYAESEINKTPWH